MTFSQVGVVGAGSWGTALSLLLHGNGALVTMWGHDARHIADMKARRENSVCLPGVALPDSLRLTAEIADLRGCDLLLLVTPSKAIREVAARVAASGVNGRAVLLSCTKGVERGSGKRMSEVIAEQFPRNPVAALSGPSHAEEVSRKMPTCVVIGCQSAEVAQRLQRAFTAPFFRAYTSDDIAGVELGGALKNIYALAAGASDGLGLGDNAKAALVTRALVELGRLGVALGGKRETFMGLSGVGDLMVTCFSRHSRNRAVGERLGKGGHLADIVASMQMVAEGVPTTYSAFECARKFGVETPIIDQVKAILDGAIAPADAMGRLLGREPKPE
jgi:glycerol-3-phosphate dehydrogenase (NAD(P)+)